MANNRIYYAIQQVSMGTGNQPARGLQSVGITTNFNLEQVFELGQLALYQNVETVPEIEVTLNKVLDGYPTLYVLATEAGTNLGTFVATSTNLAGRSNARVDLKLGIWNDTQVSVSGNSIIQVVCSGMYVSSVSYTFPVDGNFTEDVTLVGNNKVWGGTLAANAAFQNNDDEPGTDEGVGRRQYLKMDTCIFPTDIAGISSSGTNNILPSGSGFSAHFQNITISTDLGRESINELGTLAPYHRYVTFPVEVTCEFEVVSTSGDQINATESGYYTGDPSYGGATSIAGAATPKCNPRFNIQDQKIFIESCEGTKICLGKRNKLTSVNYTGGDTGGGNVAVTYSYSNFNDFDVAHASGLLFQTVNCSG
jgi:hypothetical protein